MDQAKKVRDTERMSIMNKQILDHIQSLEGYGGELMTPLVRKIYDLEQMILGQKALAETERKEKAELEEDQKEVNNDLFDKLDKTATTVG
jgi:predicted subunit of tRNA(5-methylaminomethyl-2-thiouridylate) methyltransferase